MLNSGKKNFNLMSMLLILIFSFALIGGNMLGFSLGGITISAYRVILMLSLVLIIWDRQFLNFKLYENKYLVAIAFWVLISILQLTYSKDIMKSIKYLLVMLSALWIAIVATVYINSNKKLKMISYAVCLVIAIHLSLCLVETFSGRYFNLDAYNTYVYTTRIRNMFGLYVPIGYFGNPNDLALFCLCANLFIHIAICKSRKTLSKLMFCALLVVNIFLWISTDSRTGIISFILFYAVFYMFFIKKKQIFNLSFLMCGCLAGIVAVRFLTNIDFSVAGSDSTRFNLIVNGFDILFNQTYGFGVGLGNVEYYMSFYKNTDGIINIHNWIMEILVSGGVVNFCVFMSAYLFMIWKLYKLNFSAMISFEDQIVVKCCAAFLIVFLFASLAPSSCFQSDYVWSSLAISAAIVQIYSKKYGDNKYEISNVLRQ